MNTGQTPTTDTPEGSGRKALAVVGVLGAIAVNIAAFILSAAAITAVAEAAGITHAIAWAMVAAVDGLMVTGTVVFIANKLRSRSVTYPVTVLGAGVLLSVICNALHAKAGGGHIVQLGNGAKMAVSAIPAVSLALSFHLIADMVKDSLGGHAKAEQERPGAAVQTTPPPHLGAPGHSTSGAAQTSARMNGQTARPEANQTTPTRRQTSPARTTSPRPSGRTQTSRKQATKAVAETPSKVVPIDRERVRALLVEDRDRTSADVAEKLGRADTGTLRTIVKSIRAELDGDRRLHAVNE